MIGFIKKKIWIIRFEAKRSEKSLPAFFLYKIGKWIDKQTTLFLDLLALLLFMPFVWIVRSKRPKAGRRIALFVGLEHVVDKIVIRGDYFKQQGYEVQYLSFEFSGLRAPSLQDRELVKFRKYLFGDLPMLFRKFSAKPTYVEIYYEGNLVRQYLISLLCNRKHTVTASIDRGILQFDLQIQVIPFVYGTLREKIYKRSTLILVRDPDKYNYLVTEKSYPGVKIVSDYNRVKVKEFDEASFLGKNKRVPLNILFLNGFSVERSPETLVRAIPAIIEKHPDVIFTIVGSRNELERRRVLDIAEALHVERYVKLHNWDPEAAKYYQEAVIYVMAAKFIYANIALLEAMERGLVPIVSNVDKADLIVKDGVNGFMFDDTEKDLATKINLLISNFEQRTKMGLRARNTIIETFDVRDRMNVVEEAIAKLQLSPSNTTLVPSPPEA